MTNPDPRARRVVFFVFLTVFLDLVGFGIIIPLLPFYVRSMRGSAEIVGYIFASFAATQFLATPFLGRLSDRYGRRPVILLSLAGNAAAMVLFAVATKVSLLPLLFVSRVLAGATAGNLSACQAAIADVTRAENRAAAMGRLGAGIGLGMVLGPVLGSSVSHIGAWAPPLAAAFLACADLIGAFFLMPETHVGSARAASAEAAATGPSLAQVLSQRRIVLVLGLYFFTFLYMSNMQVALALLTNQRLAWTQTEIGHVFGLFGLIMLVVQGLLIGRLTVRFGSNRLVFGGSLVSMVGLATIALAHHALPLVGGLVLLGVGLGVVNPSLSSLASDAAGSTRQGTVLGFAQSAGTLARVLGPVLGGVLFARVAGGAPFVGGAIAAVIAAGLALALNATRDAAPATAKAG
ncbi:MAG: tetracycline resistance protein [Myxococcaceae bacterium]|nr:tetracycline resistance protein [Myxococcaceae bacterium]